MSDFARVGLAGIQALHAEVVELRERVQELEMQVSRQVQLMLSQEEV